MAVGNWNNIAVLPAKRWTCGFCNLAVSGDRGFQRGDHDYRDWQIFVCPSCDKPTFFMGDRQVPGVAFGNRVGHLPADVEGLYAEARNCMTVSAYTASILTTRKLLMNVAASQGAPAGKQFVVYVNYLADNGYVPPNAKGWVDHIREKANEATHEIPAPSKDDAETLISFMEMILKLVYEYPNRMPGAAGS